MNFVNIPEFAIPECPGALALYETFALLGIENQYVRMSASDQRAIMGAAPFGKQQFMVMDNGDVRILRSACFGNDFEMAEYEPTKIKGAIAAKKKLSPGTFGPNYF